MDRQLIFEDQQVRNWEGMAAGARSSLGSDGSGEQSGDTRPSPQASAGPVLKNVPLVLIKALRNPRRDAAAHNSGTDGVGVVAPDSDLDGLARSLGSYDEPRLVEPPVVEELSGGHFRLCAGERRVEAARLAGWTDIPCLVYPPMDPVRAHTLSLIENMHRTPMHPLEEISALCISRLLANADARNVGGEARSLLQSAWEQSSLGYDIMRGLEQVLRKSGWTPEHPDVSWKAHLDDLGISMAPWERKRKLRMLNIDPDLQERLRELEITEAALRSLGTLDSEDQKKVVDALAANPSLARKVRRVARARRDGFYTSIEDALAEVQGISRVEPPLPSPAWVSGSPGVAASAIDTTTRLTAYGNEEDPLTHDVLAASSIGGASTVTAVTGNIAPPDIQDAVLQILECADRLAAAMNSLEAYGRGNTLPEPWGTWSRDALEFIGDLFPGRAGTHPSAE